ncbi:MAG: cobalt-precorrin-5B (C(1))-methyltransferase [Chloroflexota bacterium]
MVAPSTPGEGRKGRGNLRSGYTTGACAAAAAKAATVALVTGQRVEQVEITLPAGQRARFAVERCKLQPGQALCSVVKDAGDDPDVTHGAEICATVAWWEGWGVVAIEGGEGVGVVTKPGLGLALGTPAINPVPRQMIQESVRDALEAAIGERAVRVVISVPRGRELARRTLNARLGIVGGISILGTTGVVVPFSTEAYTATIDQGLSVAKAVGCQKVVLTTGRRTERFAQALFGLPEEAFVQVGDHVGYALAHGAGVGFPRAVLGLMVGKLAKIAAGEFQTHVSSSRVDHRFLARIAAEGGADPTTVAAIAGANTGRHFSEIVQERGLVGLYDRLCRLAAEKCHGLVEGKMAIECILFDFEGAVLGRAGVDG